MNVFSAPPHGRPRPHPHPHRTRTRTVIVTVKAKRQVTLRKDLLRHLGVPPGQRIEVSTLPGGRIEVRAAQPSVRSERKCPILSRHQ